MHPLPPPEPEPPAGRPVEGVLERVPEGFGFLVIPGEEPGDFFSKRVFVQSGTIARHALKPGDRVKGIARDPLEYEKFRALQVVQEINGLPAR